MPHRGLCADIDDLGEPSQVCEMCEGVDIRYVHFMQHQDYPEILGVGCCAWRSNRLAVALGNPIPPLVLFEIQRFLSSL